MRALPFLLLAACVTPTETAEVDQAIVGGQPATTTAFPTVVALEQDGDWFCTGVLVDKDWVLTAASCFDSTNATRVRIGDADLEDGTAAGLTIGVQTIRKHPQFSYSDTVWRHDVALLQLAQPVTAITPTPIRRDATALASAITQAGFGTNTNNGGGGGILRSLTTTNIDCAAAGDSGITNANLLCFDASDGSGGCYGDGGAPSFVAGAVAGIGSGGTGSSCTSGLDISTSLAAELGFIDQYVPVPQGTQPTPPPPATPPPPTNPDTPGGSGPGRDPSGGDGDGAGSVRAVSCNAGGDAGGLFALAAAAMLARRRRSVTQARRVRGGDAICAGYSSRPSRGFEPRRHRNASRT